MNIIEYLEQYIIEIDLKIFILIDLGILITEYFV